MGPWVLLASPAPAAAPTPPPARHVAARPRPRRRRTEELGDARRPRHGPGSNVSPEKIAAAESGPGPSGRNRIAELFWSSPPREGANPLWGSGTRPKSRQQQWGPPKHLVPWSCPPSHPGASRGGCPTHPGPCPTPLPSIPVGSASPHREALPWPGLRGPPPPSGSPVGCRQAAGWVPWLLPGRGKGAGSGAGAAAGLARVAAGWRRARRPRSTAPGGAGDPRAPRGAPRGTPKGPGRGCPQPSWRRRLHGHAPAAHVRRS